MAPLRRVPRWLWIAGIAALVLVAGPRTSARAPEPAAVIAGMPTAVAAIPAWVAQRERAAGIADTAVAKRIRFFDTQTPRRTAWSVVYLHGFSATRQETAPVAESVADSLRANLFETRLNGHGLPGDSLGSATVTAWLADAIEAMEIGRRLGDSVVVIGTSTGGTLAAWLAVQPANIGGGLQRLVLISPNFGPADQRTRWLTLPWARLILPRAIPFHEWTPANEEQRRFWTVRYPSLALFPMQALVEHVRGLDWTQYRAPTLLFVNERDEVVDAKRTQEWMNRVAASGTASLERVPVYPIEGEDDHVLAGRIVSPSQTAGVVQRIVQFVRP
ncbi:MAG: alpha/beta fold hydrolase [Gemmatimonadaceae bacterium]|nr:alpha/beta fold hydrolase [Gemmatimonadaceae bacterium]